MIKSIKSMLTNYINQLTSTVSTKKENAPFGSDEWRDRMVIKYGVEQTLCGVGRPPV